MEDYDVMFPVELNGQQFQVSGRYRPYCAEFLEKAAEMFEIIIFTASQKVYGYFFFFIIYTYSNNNNNNNNNNNENLNLFKKN